MFEGPALVSVLISVATLGTWERCFQIDLAVASGLGCLCYHLAWRLDPVRNQLYTWLRSTSVHQDSKHCLPFTFTKP